MQILLTNWKRRFKLWFFKGSKEAEGPHEQEGQHPQHAWWQVMCLTGVDYFSTLGYQPGIAFLAAGYISPIATIILVLLTLFGALPVYNRVAEESPHGEGSIAMLENLLSRWKGKLFVLALLGFVATDFIITITLSAADATAHVIENPFAPLFLKHQIGFTLFLIALLGAIFLKGFKEAIGIAVLLVCVYLLLNFVVISVGIYEVMTHPFHLPEWKHALLADQRVHGNPLLVIGIALLLFPKLALGLSGFETGVAVMPLVKGDKELTDKDWNSIHSTRSGIKVVPDAQALLKARIENTRKLLRTAALIMSVYLIASSFVTALLIPPQEFEEGGGANGRALAFLAHKFLGNGFGTVYDLSTISILWFAGSSAMAGLLNIVPRYLPRYGMAPNWTKATRPLAIVFTAIAFAVTLIFKADVNAQGGAYATGVLVLMSSAAVAVTLSARRRGSTWWPFLLISLVFAYTTVQNIHERPEGIKIASFFIGAMILTSFVSRILRTTELRVQNVELDESARKIIEEAARGTIRIVANRCDSGDVSEYEMKEQEKRYDNHIPAGEPIIFFEVTPGDASEFAGVLRVCGERVDGYRVLRAESPAVPNAIAAFLLHLRDKTGKIPHVYFGWSEGNPLSYIFKYIAFGEGDTAPVTHEVLRQAEDDPERRPVVHVGG
ncbi:MAG: amino acid transporter [Acidobacteria bacterium 13_1_20CM_3_53_8]|nr:MAG: amino acid transporter [Acidobacteria bacterium 13_1_20CM_3_53_8]